MDWIILKRIQKMGKEITMDEQKKRLFLIKIAYWLGIGADALWAVGLLFPQVFGMLTGNPAFHPDFHRTHYSQTMKKM